MLMRLGNDPFRPPLRNDVINAVHAVPDTLKRLAGRRMTKDRIISLAEGYAGGVTLDEPLPGSMDALLESIEKDANLSHIGGAQVFGSMIGIVANRIRIRRLLEEHPEIYEQKIQSPLIVIGFPRTGTTLLHNLLGQYPGARVPLLWELVDPASAVGGKENNQATVQGLNAGLSDFYTMFPRIKTVHGTGPLNPEECLFLLQNDFVYGHFLNFANFEKYVDYLWERDLTGSYEYYKTQLKILQWITPGTPWVLKSPIHMFALASLLKVFPDARIVQTHREPEAFLGSLCSFAAIMQRSTTRRLNLAAIGQHWLKLMQRALEHNLAIREQADPGQFLDVHYRELASDPVHTAGRVMRHFGYPEKPGFTERMRRWMEDNPRDKHGKHEYRLEHFGLDPERVGALFSDYTRRFLAEQR